MSNDLQNRLSRFEAEPPKEVWNKIVNALDAGEENSFPQRLLHYEEQPPLHLWNKIETSLDEAAPAVRVVPITRYKKPLRYVAAAASIIAIVFLAINLADNKTATGSVIGGTETVTKPVQSSVLPLNQPDAVRTPAPVAEDEPATFINRPSEENRTVTRTNRRTATFIRPQNFFPSFSFSQQFIPQNASHAAQLDFSGADNYMVYSDGDGNAMRIPKKLFHLVYCEDGDDSCSERIRQLQKKMAASATGNDFVGVLDILRQLQ